MKIIIKTLGIDAKAFYQLAKKDSNLKVIAFADNDVRKIGQAYEGVPIVSIFEAHKLYIEGEADKIVLAACKTGPTQIRIRCQELLQLGFHEDDIMIVPIEYMKGDTTDFHPILWKEYNYLEYLEFHITNRCNLKCKGCSHFISLIPLNDEVNYDKLKSDLAKIKMFIPHIGLIRILGGEPLLSDDLEDCCKFVRELYPYTVIEIVSNGTLVKQMSDSLIETIKKMDISMQISCYPTHHNVMDNMFTFLKSKGVENISQHIVTNFSSVLQKTSTYKFPYKTTEEICPCTILKDGCIYPCAIAAYINYYNKTFGTQYPDKVEGMININETPDSFTEAYNKLVSKFELCDFCNMWRNQPAKYRTLYDKAEAEDWTDDGNGEA